MRSSFVGLGAAAEAERARRLLAAASRGGSAASRAHRREREVLGLLAEGLTNRQIAERLVVSEHTVHRHVTNILRKLDLPSRTAAAAHAVRSGLLDALAERWLHAARRRWPVPAKSSGLPDVRSAHDSRQARGRPRQVAALARIEELGGHA